MAPRGSSHRAPPAPSRPSQGLRCPNTPLRGLQALRREDGPRNSTEGSRSCPHPAQLFGGTGRTGRTRQSTRGKGACVSVRTHASPDVLTARPRSPCTQDLTRRQRSPPSGKVTERSACQDTTHLTRCALRGFEMSSRHLAPCIPERSGCRSVAAHSLS